MDPQNNKILVEGVEVEFFWERRLCDCFLLASCEVNGKGLVSESHRYRQLAFGSSVPEWPSVALQH